VLEVLAKTGKRDNVYANTINNLAAVLMATGRPEKAIQYLQEALEIYEATSGRESVPYATGLNNLAAAYYEAGEYSEAEACFTRALPIIERTLGSGHTSWNSTRRNLDFVRQRLAETGAVLSG
jgi:tetratricopeptide (TPR) repeat protein